MKMKNSGFTLIEGMIVLAIFGILAAVAYPAYKNYDCKSSYSDECKEWKARQLKRETGVSSPQTTCSHGLLFDAKGNQVIGTDGKGVQCL